VYAFATLMKPAYVEAEVKDLKRTWKITILLGLLIIN